jgi:hypothetical protein
MVADPAKVDPIAAVLGGVLGGALADAPPT